MRRVLRVVIVVLLASSAGVASGGVPQRRPSAHGREDPCRWVKRIHGQPGKAILQDRALRFLYPGAVPRFRVDFNSLPKTVSITGLEWQLECGELFWDAKAKKWEKERCWNPAEPMGRGGKTRTFSAQHLPESLFKENMKPQKAVLRWKTRFQKVGKGHTSEEFPCTGEVGVVLLDPGVFEERIRKEIDTASFGEDDEPCLELFDEDWHSEQDRSFAARWMMLADLCSAEYVQHLFDLGDNIAEHGDDPRILHLRFRAKLFAGCEKRGQAGYKDCVKWQLYSGTSPEEAEGTLWPDVEDALHRAAMILGWTGGDWLRPTPTATPTPTQTPTTTRTPMPTPTPTRTPKAESKQTWETNSFPAPSAGGSTGGGAVTEVPVSKPAGTPLPGGAGQAGVAAKEQRDTVTVVRMIYRKTKTKKKGGWEEVGDPRVEETNEAQLDHLPEWIETKIASGQLKRGKSTKQAVVCVENEVLGHWLKTEKAYAWGEFGANAKNHVCFIPGRDTVGRLDRLTALRDTLSIAPERQVLFIFQAAPSGGGGE